MALSRELRRRLLVEDEPLAKRLKLAENTFTSRDLRVTKKEDLVLKWLCRVAEDKNDGCRDIWSTMKHCLRFKNISSDIVLKSEVKQSLVQTLISTLTRCDDDRIDDVLECCELIFSNSEMQQYFQSKPSSLGELMKALLADPRCREENSSRRCAASVVECFVNCYKQSVNKEEFANVFLSDVLFPLCNLVDKDRNDKLGAELHKCIQQLLFGKLRYSQFKEYNGSDENNFVGKLFAELKSRIGTAEETVGIVVLLYIFQAAVGSYKTDPGLIDLIFRKLVDSAGPIRTKLVNCMREHMKNVTFDYQNKIGDATLLEYLEGFIDEILLAESLGSTDYEAIAGIAMLNPLIVESKLRKILKRIVLEKKKTDEERASYANLTISILEAQTRLRREQGLVPLMLTTIKGSLVDHDKKDLDAEEAFPNEFKEQFSKSVSNMMIKQTTCLLRSLIFHLNTFCVENSTSDKRTTAFLFRATVDLTVAYFKGLRIYDHSMSLAGQERFVLALSDLGKTIALLADRILSIKHNKKMMAPLLTVAAYWDRVYSWIKYYVPEAAPKSLEFPISEVQMKQFFDRCENSESKRSLNKILVQQMGRNLQGSASIDVSKLLGGLEESWFIIIDETPQILSCMDNTQIAEVARLLLEDVKSSEENCFESLRRLKTEYVENNERLVNALVCQTFVNISSNVVPSMTKSFTAHVNVLKILEHGKVSKVLKEIKKDFERNEWTIMDNVSTSEIHRSLQILLSLPLISLSLDLRTIVFLVAYAVKKEFGQNGLASELCTKIMLEVLEKADIDIIDYLQPELLMQELPQSQVIQRAVISSLRFVSSWDTLKGLIKKCEADKDSEALLLDCMEKVKSKLKNNNQKELFRKAEHKLCKKLLNDVETGMIDHKEVSRLKKALKVPVAENEIPEHLNDVVKSTLDCVFASKDAVDEKLLAEGFQLAEIVLKRRSKFEFSVEVMMNIWIQTMKNPSRELVKSLLQAPKCEATLNKVFTLLHKQTILGLSESDGKSFANSLVIWEEVMNVDMGPARNTLRIAAMLNTLETLLVSEIPTESWPGVLRLVRSTFTRHAYAIRQDVDVMLLLAVRSLKEIELRACEDVFAICYYLVKFQVGFMTDRLPILLLLYGQLVSLIVRESRKAQDESRERQLRRLALDIAKFTNALVKLKKDLSRISPYIISCLVEMFSEGVMPSYVKGPLEDSVGHILSICDHHAVSLLSRALPTGSQGIFKTLYETYNKFYKFTGQI